MLAFGIMIGYICGLIFYNVRSDSIEGLNWRLMLGSGCVPPIIVFAQVLFLPESPRWLLSKKKTRKAYASLVRLRNTEIEAARDLFYISQLLKAEEALHTGNRYAELFTVPRNRRATIASFIVVSWRCPSYSRYFSDFSSLVYQMFMQQLYALVSPCPCNGMQEALNLTRSSIAVESMSLHT
jgi:MFS family permease